MSKTVAISDDLHTIIMKKKTELFEKHRVTVRISDLTDLAIKFGIEDAVHACTPNGKLKIVEEKDVEMR
jgi:hypothetical protein